MMDSQRLCYAIYTKTKYNICTIQRIFRLHFLETHDILTSQANNKYSIKEIMIMKLSNITDVQKFTAAVNACQGDVYLKSVEGDVFNLKSSLSQYIAIGRLIEESGDNLELFAQTREDEAILLKMIGQLGE